MSFFFEFSRIVTHFQSDTSDSGSLFVVKWAMPIFRGIYLLRSVSYSIHRIKREGDEKINLINFTQFNCEGIHNLITANWNSYNCMKLTKSRNYFQTQHHDASSCSLSVFPATLILLSILHSIPRRSKAFFTYHYHSDHLPSILITMRKWEPSDNISVNFISGFLSRHLWRSRSGEIFHEDTISAVWHRK